MNAKRFVFAVLAVFALSLAWNSVVHGVVLAGANAQLDGVRRTSPSLPLGLALTLVLAGLFVVSFSVRTHLAGIWDGVRQGVYFGVLAGVLVDGNQYLLYPIPLTLALSWFAFGLGEFALAGALVAWVDPFGQRRRKNIT